MWREYHSVKDLNDAVSIINKNMEKARVIAGGTDLILEIERGIRKDADVLVDITRVPGLDQIYLDEEGNIHLGPMVTHNHLVASRLIRKHALGLAQAAWQVGSPQIRNRGTVVGNLVTASPANDTIPPLMASHAKLVLRSASGERTIPLEKFYTGVRQTVMQPDEIVIDIYFPANSGQERYEGFYKLALRNAQAISVVNASVALTVKSGLVSDAAITLGAAAPVIVHAQDAEEYLIGKPIEENVIQQCAELAVRAAKPITDIRGSLEYRQKMIVTSVKRSLRSAAGFESYKQNEISDNPVLLWGKSSNSRPSITKSITHYDAVPIITTINGKEFEFRTGHRKTLLRLIREEANLIGTKEGCAEGECGACTVFLDGIAVMSCLVPAPRAHLADIVTIEGLSQNGEMHPVQSSFIETGAVQCGYCTPGFVMSATKLLEEKPNPTHEDIMQSFTGNLCRCTGYYKIIDAVELAVKKGV